MLHGYIKKEEIIIPFEKLTKITVLVSIVFLIASGVGIYFLSKLSGKPLVSIPFWYFIILLTVGVVLHELVHGIFFLLFSKFNFKSIKFGFNREYMAPYAHCNVPLRYWQYIISAIAPLVLIGMIPYIYGILYMNISVFLLGAIFIIGAAGDIYMTKEILKHAKGSFVLDHPSDIGFFILEQE